LRNRHKECSVFWVMLFTKLHAFFNPEQFQGWGKKKNYFEGWYYKVISGNEEKAFAFIPGVAMDKSGNGHAFIQVLDGKQKTSAYHRFDIQEFRPSSKKLLVQINKNSFSEHYMLLDLPGIKGELHFSGNVPWPKPLYSPGIMGPYAFAPFMECYHGIVSMDHIIQGSLHINGEAVDFTNGRGYIEKDWGRSFPSAYFWMQSNHFSKPGISLKCSVAKIPWVRNSFTGFIAGLWLNDKLYRFTTYNGTKLRRSFADEKKVEVVLENKKYLLEILAHRDNATELASPIDGFMNGRIEESMTALIEVRLTDKKEGAVLLDDIGKNAGLEVAGNIKEIFV
jgi:tocopherol cyclase